MATVCSACGERNAPDAQFCSSCHAYLVWQNPTTQIRLPQTGPPQSDGPSRAPAPPPPPPAPYSPDERDPFVAASDGGDATVTLDGAPATVTVNVANTSDVVDSYVLDAVDPPSWLEVASSRTELLPSTSGTMAAQLRLVSSRLVPAQKLALVLRVSNASGRSTYRDLPVAVTVPVVTAPIQVRAEPRQLRVRDTAAGVCRVVVSNTGTNRWAQVRLAATDPEQVVRATWGPPQLQIPPGGEEAAEVRFDAPAPEPGGEQIRTITIVAHEGHRSAETTVTLAQSASQPAIELLALRLDPGILRLGGRRRGRITAVVDNRRGAAPVSLALSGHDPERSLRFDFSPATLRVEPGREASALVAVTAPRTPPGQEVIRPLTIAASDGHADTRAEARVIQLASSRRGIARIVLTVLGALLVALGSLGQFIAAFSNSAVQWTAAQIAGAVDAVHPEFGIPDQLDAGGVEDVASIGLVLLTLAALMVFGLTGRSGRLTRASALLALVVVVATVAALTTLAGGSGPATGAVLAAIGCVVGYVGGLVDRS